jgi:hypothetical protein
VTVPASSSTAVNQPAVKKFTPAEIADRRIKGLCFKCDEKFVLGHRDSCRHLFCIKLLDDDDDGTDPTISLAALNNIQPRTRRTMHVTVLIGDTPLRVLLDSGSTHNYIDIAATDCTGISFTSGAGLRMAVANGDRLTSPSRCTSLDIDNAGEHFIICCYGLGLNSFDMVLGV